jgi:hypothetical protein
MLIVVYAMNPGTVEAFCKYWLTHHTFTLRTKTGRESVKNLSLRG